MSEMGKRQHDVCALTPLDSFQQSHRDAHLRHNDRRIVFDRSRENSDILLIDLAPR